MKERPIPFSAPMIRALLDGSKTQTRRVVKVPDGYKSPVTKHWNEVHFDDGLMRLVVRETGSNFKIVPCPYGQRRDRLWVREAWRAPAGIFDSKPPRTMRSDTPIRYEADGESPRGTFSPGKFRPPMFMPQWASRITLEITGVRVERLQEISRGDAMEEGCPFPNMAKGDDPRRWYSDLWESINGPGSWDANPWVWVVEFKRIKP